VAEDGTEGKPPFDHRHVGSAHPARHDFEQNLARGRGRLRDVPDHDAARCFEDRRQHRAEPYSTVSESHP
jgi:hypothetical protein